MIVRKLRLKKGWSQEQLAEISGLSVRTIQRIERGQSSSLESMKLLAAVLEVDIASINEDGNMTISNNQISDEEKDALQHIKEVKGFYIHLIQFLVIVTALTFINFMTMPGNYWVVWVVIGWGAGIIAHALRVFEVFNFFAADWERKQVEKRLGRKL